MADIVQIGKGRFQRKQNKFCFHEHLLYDPSDESIECADCGRNIGAFKAFMTVVNQLKNEKEHRQSKINELLALEKKNLILKAAKRVEKAWRSRSMVPDCPHCGEAIFPEDGLGRGSVNKKMAIERRKFKERSDSTK